MLNLQGGKNYGENQEFGSPKLQKIFLFRFNKTLKVLNSYVWRENF